MTATYGILPTFDHTTQVWKTFRDRITQWFVANDINDTEDRTKEKRRAILLSTLNDGTYKLASDLALPKELTGVPYDDILKLLDSHFTPKVCGFGERSKFYEAVQQQGETHAQWAARLRGLSAQCKFNSVDEALRDRFVMGMRPGPERIKLFSQDLGELTLAKAVELASSVRGALSAASGSYTAQQSDHLEQVFKVDRSANSDRVSSGKCSVCGRYNHKSERCRFANYKCKKCNVKGHLAKVCKKVNFIETNADEEMSEGDDGKLLNIRSVNGEPMHEFVCILGVDIQFEIDSGSAVTAVSESTYKQHFLQVPLLLTGKRLVSYTGNQIECIGIVKLPVKYKDQVHELNIYVVRNGGPPILGRDFISMFNLEITSVKYCTPSDTSETQQLQQQYPTVFSDKLGLFNKFKVSLQLKPDAKPVFFKARPTAFALREKIDNELDRLVSLGILKPVEHSEYASPVVPVLKSNGSLRLCADYSVSINKQLLVEQYPLPAVKELFSRLHGGQQFTKLDLSMAYQQFELSKESQNITCINTHRGLFKYTRLVFGLASAPAIFQRAIDCLLAGMTGVLCLIDDILITGGDRNEHLERLHAVLRKLQDAGLTVQKSKCEFFKDEVSYLGYVIDRNGVRKSPEKVKAIVNAPLPTDVNKLQSFLGLVNYYRDFVPGASTILSPLYDLLKKGVKWCWTDVHSDAFNKIKKCLASEKVLAHFNSGAKIILTVDASPYGLGAILSQVDSNGTERPVSYASRTLSAAEKRYSQIQKEATAIIFGVRRFHQYLFGRSEPFILRTDHKPLVSIFGPHRGVPEVSANRLQRYALFLGGYNYTIEYIRSQDNSADFLSRASLPIEYAGEGRATAGAQSADDQACFINFVVEGNLPVTLAQLRAETDKDQVLIKVKSYVQNGWPKKVSDIQIKPYFNCRLHLSIEKGCLMRGHKIVLPAKVQSTILAELHSSHLGIVKTKAEARSRFWFPGIDAALERMIGSCAICIQLRPSPPRAPLATWQYPSCPFYRLHIDFLGPLNGHSYLVIVDAYTKWVEVYNTKNNTTSTAVVENLIDFFSRFGLPQTLVSDNGTAFTSQEFKQFCELNSISHVTSPAYHPASNGQAESYVKVVKKGIKTCLMNSKNQKESKNKLMKYLFDYRNSVHSTTGIPPAQLVYGRKLRSRLDILTAPSPSAPTPPESATSPSAMRLADRVQFKQCLQHECYGGKNKRSYSINENVLYKKIKNNKKYEWCKGIIVKKMGKVTYLVKDCETSMNIKKHTNQLLLYKGELNEPKIDWDDVDVALNITTPHGSTGTTHMDDLIQEGEEVGYGPLATEETSECSDTGEYQEAESYESDDLRATSSWTTAVVSDSAAAGTASAQAPSADTARASTTESRAAATGTAASTPAPTVTTSYSSSPTLPSVNAPDTEVSEHRLPKPNEVVRSRRGNPTPLQSQPQGLIVETGNGASVLQLPATTLEQIRHIAADPGASTLRLPPPATEPPAGSRELDFDLCYVCKHCKVAFPSPAPLQAHQARSCYAGREAARGVIRVVQPALECRTCPGERFRGAAEFRRHADTETHARRAAPPPPTPVNPEPLTHEMEDVVNQITLLAARAAQESAAPKDPNANFCAPAPGPRFPPPGELPLASAGH
ncbi:uncharacterized protein K02A2.6-like [Pectinophora gossypiella]|uniref:uncharacterized protein K02A2.6-like n=1 Tax=Pectinophora gossypiella TaxID=13191 RepID=UPI00214E5E59|nr:uncharacterized protein K02A2.6-like [Pectinophora gossypiella]